MASRQHEQSLSEDLICPICLDFFTDPVSLECGHSFCRSCITQCWEKERNSCPECRQEFPERILRGSRALANLAEKARKLKLNREEKESKLHCEEHQEELKLFCETDKKLICVNCVDLQEHREHRFIPIKKAVEIYKDGVKSSLDSLTQKKSTVLEMEQQQKQKISQIRKQSDSLQSHITSEFTKMHQILTEKEQRFIRDLREEEEKILKPMEENLYEIQENLNSIQEKLSKLKNQLEQKDGVRFLKEEASGKRRISDEVKSLSLADGVLSIGKFNSPLPFPGWRGMLDVINPVSVTLDVETANPRLEVSEDLKSLSCTRTQRSLPDTRKRFTQCLCVLGSEGFTSGRHYWEVEVMKNRRWYLGVAAETVERKVWVSLSPETGFWTIGRGEDQIYINSSPRSRLPVGQIPGKVGVYLSYESGTVSFYNVDTKSHLHTFTGNKFTEKLYPFFWTGHENQFLSICSGSDPDPKRGGALGGDIITDITRSGVGGQKSLLTTGCTK
ncbi:zinc-binding protein A33-like [Scyliorhinus canicula]|uniref:zinc-binding protein A33-like n=1 Tax=Scyliorhinus canicula TaxID=7830 RepID=UPI0018F495A5|nr:zinc-binding protein A33-like [Scyliorhinus canicula]